MQLYAKIKTNEQKNKFYYCSVHLADNGGEIKHIDINRGEKSKWVL